MRFRGEELNTKDEIISVLIELAVDVYVIRNDMSKYRIFIESKPTELRKRNMLEQEDLHNTAYRNYSLFYDDAIKLLMSDVEQDASPMLRTADFLFFGFNQFQSASDFEKYLVRYFQMEFQYGGLGVELNFDGLVRQSMQQGGLLVGGLSGGPGNNTASRLSTLSKMR